MSVEYKPGEYTPTIDAILSVADLEKVSVKKIRRAIQELFAVDLEPYKEKINELILERYYRMVDERENDKRAEEKRREEMIKQDELLALKLLKDGTKKPTRQIKRPKVRKVKRTSNDGTSSNSNSAFKKEHKISPQLTTFLGGETKISRPQLVKRIWDYIKLNNLQDPSDRRIILCDEKLEAVFKKKKVNMFSMNKDLSNHIFKDDEIDDSQNDPTLTNNAAVAPDSSVVEDPEISDESDVSSAD